MKKSNWLKFLLHFAVFFVFIIACNKKDHVGLDEIKEEYYPIRDWLHANGGAYRDETIKIKSTKGDVTMKLDWSRSMDRRWKGIDFVEVPYATAEGTVKIPKNEETGETSFTLVVRKYKNGEYRGALRTTTRITDNGDKNIQDYKMLDGTQMNVWSYDYGKKRLYEATPLTEGQYLAMKAASLKKFGTLMSARQGASVTIARTKVDTYEEDDCNVTRVRVYVGTSGTNTDPADPTTYGDGVIVGEIKVSDKIYKICPSNPSGGGNNGESGNNGGGSPSGNAGVGSGGSSSNANGDSCINEAPSSPPAVNPDGTTTPYDPLPVCDQYPPEATPIDDDCYRAALAKALADAVLDNLKTKIDAYNAKVSLANEWGFSIAEHSTLGTMSAYNEKEGTENSVGIIATYGDPTYKIIGGFHTHGTSATGNPSPADFYSLISGNSVNPDFVHYFVKSASGLYDFVITDPIKAAAFAANYPIGNHGILEDEADFGSDAPLRTEYENIVYHFIETNNEPTARALAFAALFSKYDAGVQLLILDGANGMKPFLFYVSAQDADGHPIYSVKNCNN